MTAQLSERPMHSEDNQTLILRVDDLVADDGVWAVTISPKNDYNYMSFVFELKNTEET